MTENDPMMKFLSKTANDCVFNYENNQNLFNLKFD